MIHCITCKTIIPTIIDEEFGELPIEEPHITPEGHDICKACAVLEIGRKTYAFVKSIDHSTDPNITPEWTGYVQEHRSPMQRIKQFIRTLER